MFPAVALALSLIFPEAAVAARECRLPGLLSIEPYNVPSPSMSPTLPTGAYFLARCLSSATSIRRGDVVVFRPSGHPGSAYVKRVIGLPGDRVRLARAVVFVNGTALPFRPEAGGTDGRGTEILPGGAAYEILRGRGDAPQDTTGEVRVPRDCIYVLGDSRENSIDSRFPRDVGFVPRDRVLARAWLRISLALSPMRVRWWPLRPRS